MERDGPISDAIVRVTRLHKQLAGQLLRRVGLHPGQELLMMTLWECGPQRQTDLVRSLGSDAATVTRTVQRLEHAGFVRRRAGAADRRVTIVESTPAGLAVRDEVCRLWSQLEDATTAGMSAADRADTLRLLHRLEHNLAEAVHRGCGGGGRESNPPGPDTGPHRF